MKVFANTACINSEKLITENVTILSSCVLVSLINDIYLVSKILEDSLKIKNVKLNDRTKLNQFLGIINDNNIDSNVVLGKTLYHPIEQGYDEFMKFVKDNKIFSSKNSYNCLIGINSNKVYINIEEINITISNYDEKEM